MVGATLPSIQKVKRHRQNYVYKRLQVWLHGYSRYRGCVEHIGLDVTPMEELVHALRGLDENAA